MVHLVAVEHLLRWHLGPDAAHVQLGDVNRLMVAIALATAEQARRDAGHESRKDSLASLRALHRLPDDELVALLQTCDMATFGRIQTAHAELDYRRNGIPVVEIPGADLSNDDWIAACNGDVAAYVCVVDALNSAIADADAEDWHPTLRRAIELPKAGQPLHLPLGIDGLRDAIANAITAADEDEFGGAGNKPRPHMGELARVCEAFMRQYPPAPNWPGFDKAPPSPAVSFTTDVFKLAGMDRIGDSRIERMLTAARKSLDWRPKTSN